MTTKKASPIRVTPQQLKEFILSEAWEKDPHMVVQLREELAEIVSQGGRIREFLLTARNSADLGEEDIREVHEILLALRSSVDDAVGSIDYITRREGHRREVQTQALGGSGPPPGTV